jgi:hypothetical protein
MSATQSRRVGRTTQRPFRLVDFVDCFQIRHDLFHEPRLDLHLTGQSPDSIEFSNSLTTAYQRGNSPQSEKRLQTRGRSAYNVVPSA